MARLSLRPLFWPAFLLAAAGSLPGGEAVRCPVTRDVWLSAANAQEADTNGGKSPRLKLKIWQEFALLDFDVSALKGQRITEAFLCVAPAGGAVFGKERGTDLRWFSISTVSSRWEEGLGAQYAADDKGKGATFNEASFRARPWTIPGSKCWDVILGNGNTLRCDVDAGDPRDGWFSIKLDARLVEALVAGASHGLMLMDGCTGVDRNCFIHSRESRLPPYLLVGGSATDQAAPVRPAELKVEPAPREALTETGAARVSLRVPEDAFAYLVQLNGRALPRWQIPFAGKPGSVQSFLLEHLPPDAPIAIELAALDRAGNISPFASARGRSSPAITVPNLPASEWQPKGGAAPVLGGKLKVWAFPENCKLDALSGRIALEPAPGAADSRNSVWDAAAGMVRIAAARGEIASFQLALEAVGEPLSGLRLRLRAPGSVSTRLWRAWFVKVKDRWLQEYALPLRDEALRVPAPDNAVPGQKAAVVTVDLIVPGTEPPGEKDGAVLVSAPGLGELTLKLRLKVYGARIPDEIHFNPELNCYNGPGEAGSEQFFDSHRLAHYHRCSINRVTHSHSGRTASDLAPTAGPDGRVTDWSGYDRRLGPLLDGSAFRDNPRAGVPVPVLYLPQNESWPLPIAAHYRPGANLEGRDWKALHDLKARPPEQAFDAAYQEAFARSVADFARHFEQKGWTRTLAECYFNNKCQYGQDRMTGTAWTMDEPTEYLDWHALLFYSRLFHRGLAGATAARFVFRGDISRPMWQGNCFDGLMEIMYAGGDQFSMLPLMQEHKRRMPVTLMAYGSCNGPERANHQTVAWCLKAYAHECDGVLPWQSLGGDAAFEQGDQPGSGNALIVDGRKRLSLNAVASYRVHALRTGAQLAELLRLLESANGWGRGHSGCLVARKIPLSAAFKPRHLDEAAEVRFEGLGGDAFVELKEGILRLLK